VAVAATAAAEESAGRRGRIQLVVAVLASVIKTVSYGRVQESSHADPMPSLNDRQTQTQLCGHTAATEYDNGLTCGPISAAVGPWQLLHIATLLLPVNFAAGSSSSNNAVCVARMLKKNVSSESGIRVAEAPSCTRISLPFTSQIASAPSLAIVAASKIDTHARLPVAAAAFKPTVKDLASSFKRAPTMVCTDGMHRPKQLSV
jgi:hypothetical protein